MVDGTPMGRELKTILVGLSLTQRITTLICLSELFVSQYGEIGEIISSYNF